MGDGRSAFGLRPSPEIMILTPTTKNDANEMQHNAFEKQVRKAKKFFWAAEGGHSSMKRRIGLSRATSSAAHGQPPHQHQRWKNSVISALEEEDEQQALSAMPPDSDEVDEVSVQSKRTKHGEEEPSNPLEPSVQPNPPSTIVDNLPAQSSPLATHQELPPSMQPQSASVNQFLEAAAAAFEALLLQAFDYERKALSEHGFVLPPCPQSLARRLRKSNENHA